MSDLNIDVPDSEEEDFGTLVMAMPRRELFAIRGFIRTVSLPVLESLQHEHWFALPEVIADNLEAKEVRIGLLIRRGDQFLVDESGVLLHAAEVPPEVERFGVGLMGLKNLAVSAGRELLQGEEENMQLWGYLNEDSMVETRPYFILIYQMLVPEQTEAPQGMLWVSMNHLVDMALDPPSALFADVLKED